MFNGQTFNELVYGDTDQPVFSITNPTTSAATFSPTTPVESTPALKDRGIFFISDVFNSLLAKNVVTWILEANLDPNRTYDHLTLIINSPGGEVPSAFAIIDAMRGSSLPVHTIGLGQISSCGLLTFMAGAKGYRVLTPNTTILSHQWAWGSMGKEHELLARVRQFEINNERLMAHYRSCTGLADEVIREKLLPASDVWLTPTEAKEFNICDEIRIMGA